MTHERESIYIKRDPEKRPTIETVGYTSKEIDIRQQMTHKSECIYNKRESIYNKRECIYNKRSVHTHAKERPAYETGMH